MFDPLLNQLLEKLNLGPLLVLQQMLVLGSGTLPGSARGPKRRKAEEALAATCLHVHLHALLIHNPASPSMHLL
jgi:hypothetical protein